MKLRADSKGVFHKASLTPHEDMTREVMKEIRSKIPKTPQARLAFQAEEAVHLAVARARDMNMPTEDIVTVIQNMVINLVSSAIGSLFEDKWERHKQAEALLIVARNIIHSRFEPDAPDVTERDFPGGHA